uniref:Ataxin 1 n=1 Tax=Xiphophorus maculatus TaxID=8083 RepID=M4AIJ4_XIPMA
MKANQERSNGCLPPKKREILALEQRPVVVAATTPPVAVPTDSPHTENLAWLASVASERCKSRETESPRCPIPSTSSSSPTTSIPSPATTLSAVPLASLPAVYPAALPQQAGTIQFTQLGPNVQFISSGPYAGYISSHIIPTNATSAPNSSALVGQRTQIDGYTTALISPSTKGEQQFQIGLSPSELAPVTLPSSPQVTNQYIHLDNRTPLTVSGNAVASPAAHLQLHPHAAVLPQTLTLAPSQLVVQYADGSAGKKPEGHAKSVLNGEVEVVKQAKVSGANHQPVQSYEARHILLPADYGQNPAGLQTSLVLVAQASSFSSLSSSEVVKSVPHTVIQTSLPPEELPVSLYSSTQPPIIGYITSANQHTVSYHAALPQHLVIPSGQSLLIPVSSANNGTEIEVSRTVSAITATTPQISTAMPHAYLATALSKCEALASPSVSSPSSPVALPPFFMRGSIIQLADGELKRVEDLKTEDFIQSAEISSELKIDSSTVERIDCGQSPNAVLIQFSVGELKAQVCVEVLVEYPFFVFGQGWSSCCPDRTTQLFELSCAKLCVGDVCLKMGSLSDLSHCSERMFRGGPMLAGSGGAEVRQEPLKTDISALCSDPERPFVRKRRWSAPERDQTEKAEEEPPVTLPKPSFLPQEVKISIEGHSSAGGERFLKKRVDC